MSLRYLLSLVKFYLGLKREFIDSYDLMNIITLQSLLEDMF